MVEALMFAAIVAIGSFVTYEVVATRKTSKPSNVIVVDKMLEAETLPVLDGSANSIATPQDTSAFSQGQWSGGRHLFAAARAPGDTLSLGLPARAAGLYELTIYLTKSYDYGVVQVSVNGVKIGGPIDLWSYGVESTGPIRLGEARLKGVQDVISVEVIGKNDKAAAPFYQFGIDGVVFEPKP